MADDWRKNILRNNQNERAKDNIKVENEEKNENKKKKVIHLTLPKEAQKDLERHRDEYCENFHDMP